MVYCLTSPECEITDIGGGGGRVGAGQAACEQRIEVIVKMQKKSRGEGCQVRPGIGVGAREVGLVEGEGVRVDVNKELKVL